VGVPTTNEPQIGVRTTFRAVLRAACSVGTPTVRETAMACTVVQAGLGLCEDNFSGSSSPVKRCCHSNIKLTGTVSSQRGAVDTLCNWLQKANHSDTSQRTISGGKANNSLSYHDKKN
jgi:hypothetical protein